MNPFSRTSPALRRWALAALLVLTAVSLASYLTLRRAVRRALDDAPTSERPLQFVSLSPPDRTLARWGGTDVEGVAVTAGGLVTAGGSGVWEGARDLTPGLPTLRASSLALWRGQVVVGLAAGGLFRLREGRWEEARSGWGTLNVRALAETPAGELLIGARQGLFRAAWGGTTLERLAGHPVRSVALGHADLLAGGEEGLHRVESGRTQRLETPDPWVEWVGAVGGEAVVLTAAGLARGPRGGPFHPVSGGDDVVSGTWHEDAFWGVIAPPSKVVRRLGERLTEERLPAVVRRLFSADGVLLADTIEGLHRRTPSGWLSVRTSFPSLPAGSAHVSALAFLGSQLVAGFFDGGLATAEVETVSPQWRAVPGAEAWGVNALLPAGGALYVASLRGAARFDGARLHPLPGPGAAFSLAATGDGVAIGYGQGVLLPGPRLLSAFHGLPGNQALALASGSGLFVGTPSGLGALHGRRVAWRVTSGEGKLPHPWVTALALSGDALYVGTYGGGIVRRIAGRSAPGRLGSADAGRYEPFPETEGLKIGAGCLVEARGRLYAGTEGRGLWALSSDGSTFTRLDLPLPSPRVTALHPAADALWIGTDEGLTRLGLDGNEATEAQRHRERTP